VTLRFDEISLAAARLFSTPLAERVRLVGIETGREATLPSGALILERCLFALHADACRVSVRGWRHAMLEEI
jgi:exopolyphosphatase/guanosine-5'-triphosphate,3'-diphosphate pyrophosphatase